ncbi:MAG: PEGA domain-containing protein [Candidatus Omnitrophota bacterium]
MQLLRKILFYTFAVIYITVCPLVILYAFGYIYKPGTKEGILKTGLIYLSTAPAGATIYMGNSRYTQKTPTIIQELLPGSYPIKVALEDYLPWTQTVPVEAEKATVLDKVLLLPREWKSKELIPGRVQDIIAVPGTDFFLAKKGMKAEDVLVCDYEKGKAWPLLGPGSPFRESKVLSYYTSKKSPSLLLRVSSARKEKFLWIELKENGGVAKDITNLFQMTPVQVKWLPGQDYIFVLYAGRLDRVDVASGAVYPEYVLDVRGFDLFDGKIYVLKKDNTFLVMDSDKKTEKMLLGDQKIGDSIFRDKGHYNVEVLSEELILFLGENGALLANRLPYRFVGKGVRGMEFDPKGERVLIWSKDRIGVLDFSAEKTGNVGFEKGPALAWVYTQGKDIGQASWVYEASHILFRDSSNISLIEIEGYGEFKIDPVFKVNEKSSVFYSDKTGEMYFSDATSGELFSVVIMPEESLIPLELPDLSKIGKSKKIEELWNLSSQEAD